MIKIKKRRALTAPEYVEGVLRGDRVILSRAITLVESTRKQDRLLAEEVLEKLMPHTGGSLRVGVTGVPGVGKSTFLESFGMFLAKKEKSLAVLTIDPSSQKTKGSILGDKTRMEILANEPLAYIRPSPSGKSLGGVHEKTRETMLLCEAAGFDVVLIETVGVGQSEVAVEGMVDFFLLLMLAGAGDELQGIKRGIMEIADALVITKADGDNVTKSEMARRQYQNALHLFPPNETEWYPKVLKCSSLEETGMKEIWDVIMEFEEHMRSRGFLQSKRSDQSLRWLRESLNNHLLERFYEDEQMRYLLSDVEKAVSKNQVPVSAGVRRLIDAFAGQ
ncbi:ATPase/protein kinase [Fulvitalea axinellae]|uniref:ATPase/protein kinase n=1 Tax=Fulvitalea axinellae TaxID=1182444 RepID=A0AAU9CAI2_9BACT|nr:ATPase/protein kinase [Fulvitalea axinellae]